MSVLITGASGLLGSHILKHFAFQNTIPIKAHYRNESKKDKICEWLVASGVSLQNIRWIKADITDVFAFDEFIDSNDYIIHTAAVVNVLDRNNAKIYETNVNSTQWLLDAAKRRNCSGFCFISSVAALGQNAEDELLINESTTFKRLKTSSSYAESKFVSEMSVWSASVEGMNVVTLKPSVILGWSPGNYDIINMALLMDKKWFKAPPGSFGFVHADDIAEFCFQVYSQNIFNQSFILNNLNLTYEALYKMLAKASGRNWNASTSKSGTLKLIGAVCDVLRKVGFKLPFSRHLAETVSKRKSFDNSKSKEIKGFEYSNFELKTAELFMDFKRYSQK